MEVVEKMCGKWKNDDDATENFDNYAAAMKMPAELVEKIKSEKGLVWEMTRNGDTFDICTNYSTGPDKISFKLNEPFKSNSMGVEVENLFTVEGDVVVGKHTFLGNTTSSRRYVKDGKLVVESEGNGAVMKHYLNKC